MSDESLIVHRPVLEDDDVDLHDSYDSFKVFEAAFKQYQTDTWQTFIVDRTI